MKGLRAQEGGIWGRGCLKVAWGDSYLLCRVLICGFQDSPLVREKGTRGRRRGRGFVVAKWTTRGVHLSFVQSYRPPVKPLYNQWGRHFLHRQPPYSCSPVFYRQQNHENRLFEIIFMCCAAETAPNFIVLTKSQNQYIHSIVKMHVFYITCIYFL